MKTSLKKLIERQIRNLCNLTDYNLKEIVWLDEYQKVKGLELICKESSKWADFFNLYHTYMEIHDNDTDWVDSNRDVSDQTTVLSYLTDNVESFGEKDGIFYVVERKETLIHPRTIKKVFCES